jgi:hypothetical protein
MFTDVDWRDGRLIAWTWESSMITVDPNTGRVLISAVGKSDIAITSFYANPLHSKP